MTQIICVKLGRNIYIRANLHITLLLKYGYNQHGQTSAKPHPEARAWSANPAFRKVCMFAAAVAELSFKGLEGMFQRP